jgi:DNA repair exonuclease SbcCD ATPase subunit
MANPINAAQLADLDEMLKRLNELQDKLSDLKESEIQEAKKLEKAIRNLTEASADQREEIELTAAQAKEIKKRYDKYNESLNDGAVKIAALKEAQRKLNNVNKLEAKILASKEGSYDRLSAQYSLNKMRLNQMSAAERRATVEGKKLEKQTAEIYNEMKRLQEATGKHTLSVGDYAKANERLLSKMEEMPGALGKAAGATESLKAQFTKLIKHPVVFVIAAIVAGLQALFSIFKKTATGSQTFEKAMSVSEAIVSKLVEVVDKAAKMLSKDFVGGLKKMAKAALDFLRPVADMFVSWSEVIVGALTFDHKKITRGLDELGKSFVELFKKLSAGKDDLTDLAKAIQRVKDAKKDLIRDTRDYTNAIEELSTKEAEYQIIAGDTTKSLAKRNKASIKASKALEKRAAIELELARRRLKIVQLEIANNKGKENLELFQQETEALREVAAAERELRVARLESQKERAEFAQDQLERDLDVLIDGFDNQKTINEKRIADDKRTMKERTALLAQTAKLGKDSFDAQIALIQTTTDKQIDANDLLTTSDARVLAEKLKGLGLSDIITGRLLESLRDRKTAIQDLEDAYKDLTETQTVLQTIDLLGVQISENEVDKVKEQIKELRSKVVDTTKSDDKGLATDIYDLLGIDFGDEGNDIFRGAVDQFKSALNEITQARIKAADNAVAQSEREINAAQNALQNEISNRNAGYAANVEGARKELELAKSNQEKALKEREKAQKAQIALDTATQASSLITAVANIWREFSKSLITLPLAIGATAAMFGSFAVAKVKAIQATKQEFGEGGYEVIGGGSHASGNDTYLGFETKDGKKAYGERGEAHMIFDKNTTSKYKKVLPHLFKAVKQDKLREFALGYAKQGEGIIQQSATIVDMNPTNNELKKIRKQGSEKRFTNSKGQLVVQRGNIKTTYV